MILTSKTERIVLVLTGLSAVLLLFVATKRTLPHSTAPKPPKPLTVAASRVIGSRPIVKGNPDAKFTLVEFADYQCPACFSAEPELVRQLDTHHENLRFVFRNFPLTKIHPYSQRAALAGEAARIQGKFMDMHDALMQSKGYPDRDYIDTQVNSLRLNRSKYDHDVKLAESIVEEDKQSGNELKIPGTPTFFLCMADGRVLQLGSLKQIAELVK